MVWCNWIASPPISSLARSIITLKATTPTRYPQQLPVESAKHPLVNRDGSIKAVSLKVGYQHLG